MEDLKDDVSFSKGSFVGFQLEVMNDQLLKEVQDFMCRLYQCMTDLLPWSPESN